MDKKRFNEKYKISSIILKILILLQNV